MKILLDENIDVNFKEELKEYEINTVRDNGWTGIENGKLPELIVRNNYNTFITLDSNLIYQQNLSNIKTHIIILKAKDSRLVSRQLDNVV
jgi:predicted nuclease of predicted toxin-antitoxin system